MAKEDALLQSSLNRSGQGGYTGQMSNSRAIYPAIVVPYGINDNSEQNRIRARIVSVNDDDGKIKGKSSYKNEESYDAYAGKDRNILDKDLVLCMPLLPQFFHVKPQVGEMVFVIIENPSDSSSIRYWIGPIVTSKFKLKYQGFEDAYKMFNKTSFLSNPKVDSSTELAFVFPQESDVAIQGRNDADLILKSRESLLVAGKFKSGQGFEVNTEYPSYLNLKQIDKSFQTQDVPPQRDIQQKIRAEIIQNNNKFVGQIIVLDKKSGLQLVNDTNSYTEKPNTIKWLNEQISDAKRRYPNWEFESSTSEFKDYPKRFFDTPAPSVTSPPLNTNNEDLLQKYSQATLVSTLINIYSPRGKFRGDELKSFEINKDLKSFDKTANSLHPAIFGDEAVKLLDIIIRVLITHIHTPEMPPLQTALIDELKKYSVDGDLQNLLSNHIRIN